MNQNLIEMLAEKLPDYIKQEGAYAGILDVAKLAEEAGLARQTIYNANNIGKISPSTARAIIKATGELLEMKDFTPFF